MTLQFTVEHCPRCGHTHRDQIFKPLAQNRLHPPVTHYSICPLTQEPIVLWHQPIP